MNIQLREFITKVDEEGSIPEQNDITVEHAQELLTELSKENQDLWRLIRQLVLYFLGQVALPLLSFNAMGAFYSGP